MYICPSCNEEFKTEESLTKHFLYCWKKLHPYHKSKSAPKGKDIETIEIDNDIANFFNSFKEI